MKRMIATVALLFALFTTSNADAGLMYGNRLANRLSAGTSGFSRVYRFLGRIEYRKDMWLFGRPLGDPPTEYCPDCGQPMWTHGGYYYYQSNEMPSNQAQPAPVTQTPADGAK